MVGARVGAASARENPTNILYFKICFVLFFCFVCFLFVLFCFLFLFLFVLFFCLFVFVWLGL